jgi:SecD/SecF fusion protein
LDIQGGVQLAVGIDDASIIDGKLGHLRAEVNDLMTKPDSQGIVSSVEQNKETDLLEISLVDAGQYDKFIASFKMPLDPLELKTRNGATLTYQLKADYKKMLRTETTKQVENIIRNRIDKWGVSEPYVSRREANQSIIIQLPGFKDAGEAKRLLGRTAQLKFRLVDEELRKFEGLDAALLSEGVTLTNNGGQVALSGNNPDLLRELLKGKLGSGRSLHFQKNAGKAGQQATYVTYVVKDDGGLSGERVRDAFVAPNAQAMDPMPSVALRFTPEGALQFAEVTGANIGKRLAIILDEEMISAPSINSKIPNGEAVINLGGLRAYDEVLQEASELSLVLKSGALPATIKILEERQVGATLGPELAQKGIIAVIIGLVCVLIYMAAYYRKPGLVACVALTLNGLFILALMSLIGFSLTLPGIAGFVLTLGMAVDANVLINERIRQEIAEGRSGKTAIRNGFQRVFWTIMDSNLTSMIAALVLLETNSSGPIRGFAVTLIVGLLVSLFTALYCSRIFFEWVASRVRNESELRNWLAGKVVTTEAQTPKVHQFMAWRKHAAIVSSVLVAITFLYSVFNGLNWGVDFKGGTEILVRFQKDIPRGEIEAAAKKGGIDSLGIQSSGSDGRDFALRFGAEDLKNHQELGAEESAKVIEELKNSLTTELKDYGPEILSVDFVGPQIGREFRIQGLMGVIYALLAILLYISVRFDFRFAPGAIIKMVHDGFIMLAFYAFFGRSFDLTSIAASLTVIGYSVNDVVVIYDKIRENLGRGGRMSLLELINLSVNQTLTRSLNTSLVTLLSLTGLLVLGTGQIWNFAMAMAVGVIAATYSSTFVATASVYWFSRFKWANKASAADSKRIPVAT